ncbi:MAG: cation-transporting P-type ATPase [Patescibacteria group bacterium]|nr:cation-transporting P-type ATPase [Patescibacteria group bacterium]
MNTEIIQSIWSEKNTYRGLSVKQAAELAVKYGPNERPRIKRKTRLKMLWDIFSEPMMLLIIITAVVYYFIGDLVETAVFFLSIIPIGLMQYFQQKRTDQAVAELDKMISEQCKVYRGGRLITLDIKNLVPGDLVHLTAGDKLPADGFLFSGPGLLVDEAVLTGESSPATKKSLPDKPADIAGEHKLFQGTLVTQGGGELFVDSTGLHTQYGRLGSLLEKIIKEKTPLQKKINHLIRSIAIVAMLSSGTVGLILALAQGWKEATLGALTMAMSLIPEEFPVVFSVFLILGVWRLAKKNALVREMAMVETLGSATVICTDKTGTLTEGRMSLERVFYNHKAFEIKTMSDPTALVDLMKPAILSLERIATDPLEIEAQNFTAKIGVNVQEFFDGFELLKDSPFDAHTKMVHHIWRDKITGACAQYSVGAPEVIIGNCALSEAEKKQKLAVYEEFAAAGLRVIALAVKNCDRESIIAPTAMNFVGLLAMSDPPRSRVREAIQMCQEAGIRVMMITGDNKMTAHNVAEQVGLKHDDMIISGDELEKMSPSALRKTVAEHNIFARVRPDQKFLIVEALQKNGEVVAMTGDGVNDAPALKKANIGVAMGQKGTEVARQAAGIVLMDDNFATIARAVKEGRKTYRNMQQAFMFLLSFHLPIVGLAVIPLFFGQPLIFLPIHIIFLELICDPAAVLGFEKEKAPRNVMRVPPRPVDEPLINPRLWKQVVVQALAIFIVSFGLYCYFGFIRHDFFTGTTLAFGSLVVSQIMLIFTTREWQQIKNNLTLAIISLATFLGLTVIFFVPFLRGLFHLATISWLTFGLIFVVSFIVSVFAGFVVIRGREDN